MDIVVEFVQHGYAFISGALSLGLQLLWVLIALGILGLITARRNTAKNAAKKVAKLGYFQVHPTTNFDRQYSIATRIKKGAITADLADDHAETEPGQKLPKAVLTFDGDPRAAGRRQLSLQVDEILANKSKLDGVAVVITSPGGGVAEYGHGYAEMERLRDAGVDLTILVDTYAASGGYMMSLPGNRIFAAPYAMVGSIGVVAEVMNFHDLLKNLGVTPLLFTAGRHKRSITPTSEVTDEGKAHFAEQLATIHRLFIASVLKYRPNVNPDEACTGAAWTAQESVEKGLNLVDGIGTSQDYLFKLRQTQDLVFITAKSNPFEKGLLRFLTTLSMSVVDRVMIRLLGENTTTIR